jgi:hypothetical protein
MVQPRQYRLQHAEMSVGSVLARRVVHWVVFTHMTQACLRQMTFAPAGMLTLRWAVRNGSPLLHNE